MAFLTAIIKKGAWLILFCLILGPSLVWAVDSVEQIQNQINELNKKLQALEDDSNRYAVEIQNKRKEANNLKNTISILDTQVKQTNKNITTKKLEIEKKLLEITETKKQIVQRDGFIVEHRQQLSETVREWQKLENQPWWMMFAAKQPISAFFQSLNLHESLQKNISESLTLLQAERTSLKETQNKLEIEQKDLASLKKSYESKLSQLQTQENTKTQLLKQTQNSEKKFQALLKAVEAEQTKADSEIKRLEKVARDLLAAQHKVFGSQLTWPVPSHLVTCIFHDPTYPFRTRFPHTGIDIRAAQGTPIAVAEDGYVAIAKDAGYGYSYILVVHGNGISTVYGHVSNIAVQNGQYVTRGQIIGRSGGTPGTRGAGSFVTGPHLHFEVRLNGEPVDPLNYLP